MDSRFAAVGTCAGTRVLELNRCLEKLPFSLMVAPAPAPAPLPMPMPMPAPVVDATSFCRSVLASWNRDILEGRGHPYLAQRVATAIAHAREHEASVSLDDDDEGEDDEDDDDDEGDDDDDCGKDEDDEGDDDDDKREDCGKDEDNERPEEELLFLQSQDSITCAEAWWVSRPGAGTHVVHLVVKIQLSRALLSEASMVSVNRHVFRRGPFPEEGLVYMTSCLEKSGKPFDENHVTMQFWCDGTVTKDVIVPLKNTLGDVMPLGGETCVGCGYVNGEAIMCIPLCGHAYHVGCSESGFCPDCGKETEVPFL